MAGDGDDADVDDVRITLESNTKFLTARSERKSKEVKFAVEEKLMTTAGGFGRDFYNHGKVMKLNERLDEFDEHDAEGLEVVISRDGRVALVKSIK